MALCGISHLYFETRVFPKLMKVPTAYNSNASFVFFTLTRDKTPILLQTAY